MSAIPTLGDRVRTIRKRRGLTQIELAGNSGVSASLIRKLEQGAIAEPRSETVRRLAVALKVPTTRLTSRHDDPPPARPDVDAWAPVQRALEGRHEGSAPDEPVTLVGVETEFAAAKPLFRQARFTQLRDVLPRLLRDADQLVAEASGTDSSFGARRARSRIRQMVGWSFVQTWQFEAADHAIELAIDDAPDQATRVPLVDAECFRYIRAGDLGSARELAIKWADDIEPHRISKASFEELAAWGVTLLRVSAAAVRDNRPGEAADALKFARMAAMGLNRGEYNSSSGVLHAFGPVTVAMAEAENAMIEDLPDVVLNVANRIADRNYPLPWAWNRHRLDVASALVATHKSSEAINVLQDIHRTMPEWLPSQHYARNILGRVVDQRRTLTPEIRELADAVRLPY